MEALCQVFDFASSRTEFKERSNVFGQTIFETNLDTLRILRKCLATEIWDDHNQLIFCTVLRQSKDALNDPSMKEIVDFDMLKVLNDIPNHFYSQREETLEIIKTASPSVRFIFSAYLTSIMEKYATKKPDLKRMSKEGGECMFIGDGVGIYRKEVQDRVQWMESTVTSWCPSGHLKNIFALYKSRYDLLDTLLTNIDKIDAKRTFLERPPCPIGIIKNFCIMYDDRAKAIEKLLARHDQKIKSCIFAIIDGECYDFDGRQYDFRLALMHGDKVGTIPIGMMYWYTMEKEDERKGLDEYFQTLDIQGNPHPNGMRASSPLYIIEDDGSEGRSLLEEMEKIGININVFNTHILL